MSGWFFLNGAFVEQREVMGSTLATHDQFIDREPETSFLNLIKVLLQNLLTMLDD